MVPGLEKLSCTTRDTRLASSVHHQRRHRQTHSSRTRTRSSIDCRHKCRRHSNKLATDPRQVSCNETATAAAEAAARHSSLLAVDRHPPYVLARAPGVAAASRQESLWRTARVKLSFRTERLLTSQSVSSSDCRRLSTSYQLLTC